MTMFMKNGNTFRAANEEMLDLHKVLPVGNYIIKQDPFGNFFFEQVDSFELGHKIYGDTTKNADRMLNTFHTRPNSTGVMLAGEKGSGKTLLAKMLSIKAAEQGMPTIIINSPWSGDVFNSLMQSIEQPCMILFDEFEKVYDSNEQTAILTLLDGVFPSKKLFVLTCNDKWRIDENMRNRPGRIFYMMDFLGLDVDFIIEYCKENLDDQNQIDNVCRISTMFSQFNFDLLKALCEEMNRYKETAQEAIKLLNAKPQAGDGGRYKVTLKVKGVVVPDSEVAPSEWRGNPITSEKFSIAKVDSDTAENISDCWDETPEDGAASMVGRNEENNEFKFTYLNLKKVDPSAGTFVYTNDDGATVTFTKIVQTYNAYAF